MGDENENIPAAPEEPKKAKKKSPFADMKAVGVGGDAEANTTAGLPLRELTAEEQAELTAQIFGVKPPSPGVAEAAGDGTSLARTEGGEGEASDDAPDALDVALEELPGLTKLIQEGGVTLQRGLVKGFKLITRALEVLAETDDDEDDPDEEPGDEEVGESVLTLKDAVGFVQAFASVGTLLELLYGTAERKAAFVEFTAKCSPQEQAVLGQTLGALHVMLEVMPRRIAELSDASEDELAQAGLEFLEKMKAQAQATLNREAKRKGG